MAARFAISVVATFAIIVGACESHRLPLCYPASALQHKMNRDLSFDLDWLMVEVIGPISPLPHGS